MLSAQCGFSKVSSPAGTSFKNAQASVLLQSATQQLLLMQKPTEFMFFFLTLPHVCCIYELFTDDQTNAL